LDVAHQVLPNKRHHGVAPSAAQSTQTFIQRLELTAESLPVRLPPHHKATLAAARDEVGKPQETEDLGSGQPVLMAGALRLVAEA
jgi:hypothetical protein